MIPSLLAFISIIAWAAYSYSVNENINQTLTQTYKLRSDISAATLTSVHYSNAVENQIADTIQHQHKRLASRYSNLDNYQQLTQKNNALATSLDNLKEEIKVILDLEPNPEEGITDEVELLGDLATESTDIIDAITTTLISDKNSAYEFFLTWSAIIIVLGIIFNLTTLIVMRRIVLKPLKQNIQLAQDIATGDLTKSIQIHNQDEFGELTDAMNLSVGNLNELITAVSTASNELETAGEQLHQASQKSNQSAEQQQQQTNMIATAISELSQTASEVSNNANNAADTAKSSGQQTQDSRLQIETIIRTINHFADDMTKISASIQSLEQRSENIGNVATLITGIAEQTNLLALNAAIEAARAGEQGRGFAVVADEVRTLASRTQNSTEEIHQAIEALQSGMGDTVRIIASSREQVGNAVQQAGSASEALDTITMAIDNIATMSADIAQATQQQCAVAEDVHQHVADIHNNAQQNAENTQLTSNASISLGQLTVRLKNLVQQFTV